MMSNSEIKHYLVVQTHSTIGGGWLRLRRGSLFGIFIRLSTKWWKSAPSLFLKNGYWTLHLYQILRNYLMEKIPFIWAFWSSGRASADECHCLTHEGTLTSTLLQADILCVSHLMDGRIGQSASRPRSKRISQHCVTMLPSCQFPPACNRLVRSL